MEKSIKFFYEAFNKLFQFAGFSKFDLKFIESDPRWFDLKCWTTKKSEKYKQWFIKNAIKTFNCSRKTAEEEYNFFNLRYGWKEQNGKSKNNSI